MAWAWRLHLSATLAHHGTDLVRERYVDLQECVLHRARHRRLPLVVRWDGTSALPASPAVTRMSRGGLACLRRECRRDYPLAPYLRHALLGHTRAPELPESEGMRMGSRRHTATPGLLVIDEDLGLCDALTPLLEDAFQVATAATGAEGFTQREQSSIPVVRLDLRWPDLLGAARVSHLACGERADPGCRCPHRGSYQLAAAGIGVGTHLPGRSLLPAQRRPNRDPPLRWRRVDIPLLLTHFLHNTTPRMGVTCRDSRPESPRCSAVMSGRGTYVNSNISAPGSLL
jgi:hypothetical protein